MIAVAAILAWALAGCAAWQRLGLAPPEGVTGASAAYLEAEDTLDVREGERCSVTVSFDEPYDGPIELIAVTAGETTEAPA